MEENSACSLFIKIVSLSAISNDMFSAREVNDGFTMTLSSSLDNGQPLKKDVSFIIKPSKEIEITSRDFSFSFLLVSSLSATSLKMTISYSDKTVHLSLQGISNCTKSIHSISIRGLCIEFSCRLSINGSFESTKNTQEAYSLKKVVIPQMIQLKKNILEEVIENNFYEAFFISGLSRTNPQVSVSNSSKFKSQCLHNECSKYSAYNPTIVYSFIKKNNTKIDINDYTAKLCFPTGIKVCYNTTDNSINKKRVLHNVITGGNGCNYYLTALMFFIEFPLESFPSYFPDINLMKPKSSGVLLPFCFCLVSSYYCTISSEGILTALLDDFQKELTFDQDLLHLIYEIPLMPSSNSSMTVYFPQTQVELTTANSIELNEPFIELFKTFSVEVLAIVLSSLLMESKVIVVSSDQYLLFNTTLGLRALIYPFKWRGTFIPNITEDSVRYVQSFIPFIMGMSKEIFDNALQLKSFNNKSNILIIDIDEKSLLKLTPNGILMHYDKESIKNELTACPISHYLISKLSQTDSLTKQKIKNYLLKSIAKMLFNYESYISYVGTNVLFNQPCFVSSLSNSNEKYSLFYTEMTSTQQFNEFLQEKEKEEFKHFNSLCLPKEKNGHSIDTLSNDEVINEVNDISYSLFPYFFKATNRSKESIESDIKNYYKSLSNEAVNYVLYEDAFIWFDLIMKNAHPKELRLYTLEEQDESLNILHSNSDNHSFSNSKAMNDSIDNKPKLTDNDKDCTAKDMRNSINSRRSTKSYRSVPYRKTVSLVNMVLHSNTFNEIDKYQDQISELLRDYMGYALINKQLPLLNTISEFSLCFSKPIIRKEFSFIIFQNKFKQGYKHELIASIYEHFSQMVFYVLLNTKDARIEYENVRLITKSLLYYFTRKGKHEKEFLVTPIVKHGIVFPFWTNRSFWELYYKEELIENPLEDVNVKEDVVKIMGRLNIDAKFIEYCKTKQFK